MSHPDSSSVTQRCWRLERRHAPFPQRPAWSVRTLHRLGRVFARVHLSPLWPSVGLPISPQVLRHAEHQGSERAHLGSYYPSTTARRLVYPLTSD